MPKIIILDKIDHHQDDRLAKQDNIDIQNQQIDKSHYQQKDNENFENKIQIFKNRDNDFYDLGERVRVTQQYKIILNLDRIEEFNTEFQIHSAEDDEIIFAIEEKFYEEKRIEKSKEISGDVYIPGKVVDIKSVPFFLFDLKEITEKSGSINKIHFLGYEGVKERLLKYIKNIENKKKKIVELIVCVAKILTLKDEEHTGTLSFVENEKNIIKTTDLSDVKYPLNDYICKHKKTAVFVHGLASGVGDNFLGLYKQLEDDYNILAFSYCTVKKTISSNGDLFAKKLEEFKKMFPDQEIHIFSHSMGGLVSRWAINKCEAPFSSLVMAGTPNNGAYLPDKIFEKEFASYYFLLALLNEFSSGTWNMSDLKDLFQQSVPGIYDLGKGSSLIKTINDAEDKKQNFRKYFVLAGNIVFEKQKMNSDIIVSVDRVSNIEVRNKIRKFCGYEDTWNHFQYYDNNDKIKGAINVAKIFLGN